jgi:proteasome accessory factor C
MDQPKTETILRMLVLLSGGNRYTVPELSMHFSRSKRTVYRDLETIENAGFVINRAQSRYSLNLCPGQTKKLHRLLHFSEEEAYILYRALEMVKGGTSVNEQLVRKLNALYDFRALSHLSIKPEMEIVHTLNEAILFNKQVNLHSYRSSHSETIADRIVEPFEFLPEYAAVWCFDLLDQTCKQFKISRIAEVSVLNSSWQNQTLHRVPFTDAFRMSAPSIHATVKAELSLKAANLLREEYPLAEKYLSDLCASESIHYLLSIPVADFHGIGRFALGLPGEVKILGPEEFKDFLREAQKKMGL